MAAPGEHGSLGNATPEYIDDPIYRRCRLEAFLILGLWFCCFLWTTIYCYLFGYLTHEPLPEGKSFGPDIAAVVGRLHAFDRQDEFRKNPDSLTTPLGLGIPDWVFWGIVVPWVLCIGISVGFCVFVFREDDLRGEDEPDDEFAVG